MPAIECPFCQCSFGWHCHCCPHCGRPSRFPNVETAQQDQERQALEQRYQKARNLAVSRPVRATLDSFTEAVNRCSQAVINRPLSEVQRLANSHLALYAGYYKMLSAEIRLPDPDSEWDQVRASVDSAMFPNYHENVFFAALTLNGAGLDKYGDCSVVLREESIAHRASVFEENSIIFVKKHQLGMGQKIPPGYRAAWEDRGRLSAAKLADRFDASTSTKDFPALLLQNGTAAGSDDAFVEVHIYGSMSVCTMKKVTAKRPSTRASRQVFKGLSERLARYQVPLELR